MAKQDIPQQLIKKSQSELKGAFVLGNDELAKKWSPDVSQEFIATGIAKRNLLAAYVNRYMHQFEAAGLWYLHGIVAGYLAEDKPDFISGMGKYVQFPVLAVDEVEYCVSWLYRDYGPRYAAYQAKKLFHIYLGRSQGPESSVCLKKYRFLWDEESELDDAFEDIDLGAPKELDIAWRRYLEMPEAYYKNPERAEKTRKVVMAGFGSAQLQEEVVEKLIFADITLNHDEKDANAAAAKKANIKIYNEKLDGLIVAKLSRATAKEQELIRTLDGGQALLAMYYSEENSTQIAEYQTLVAEIEALKGQQPGLRQSKLQASRAEAKTKKELDKAELELKDLKRGLAKVDSSQVIDQMTLGCRLVVQVVKLNASYTKLKSEKEAAVSKYEVCQGAISVKKEKAAILLVDLRAARSQAIEFGIEDLNGLERKVSQKEQELEVLRSGDDAEAMARCERELSEANQYCVKQRIAVHQAQEGAWALKHYCAEIGADRAKSRFWDQVKNLHESYRSDPIMKLSRLIGAVEPGADELHGIKAGIPVGTPAGLRHLLFLFLEKAPQAWAIRIPEILKISGLTYVSATSEEQKLSKDDIQSLTKVIVDGVSSQLKEWCARVEAITISSKHDASTRESLSHLLASLRRELYGPAEWEKQKEANKHLRKPVEKGNDMFDHPSLVSPRYISACKLVNTLKGIVGKVQSEKEIGIQHRFSALEDELAAVGLTQDMLRNRNEGGAFVEEVEVAKEFVEQGWSDYGDMLHFVAEHAYRSNILAFYLHLLKQGGQAGSEREGASVTAVLCRKAYLSRPGAREQCWNMFSVARISGELFETEAGTTWMTEIAHSIMDVAAADDQSLSNLYRERDIEYVENILRRLVLDLCLGEINSRTIWRSESFQSLMNFWRYNQFGFPTPQTDQEEQQRLGAAATATNVPERTHLINLHHVKTKLMSIVRELFSSSYYQGLEGVKLLAEPSINKRKDLLKEVSELYLDQARTMEVTLNIKQFVDRPASKADPEAAKLAVRKEEARLKQELKKQEEAFEKKMEEQDRRLEEVAEAAKKAEKEKAELKVRLGDQDSLLHKIAVKAEKEKVVLKERMEVQGRRLQEVADAAEKAKKEKDELKGRVEDQDSLLHEIADKAKKEKAALKEKMEEQAIRLSKAEADSQKMQETLNLLTRQMQEMNGVQKPVKARADAPAQEALETSEKVDEPTATSTADVETPPKGLLGGTGVLGSAANSNDAPAEDMDEQDLRETRGAVSEAN